MQHHTTDTAHVVILNKGESVIASLTEFCTKAKITNATLTGLGAVEWVSCGYYDLPTKEYHFTTYDQLLEVVSMTGNVMQKEGAPYVHLHAVFTDQQNHAFGGHVEEMRVGVTLEVVVRSLPSSLERHYDEDIGLFLIN